MRIARIFSLYSLGILLDSRGRPEPQTKVENGLRRNAFIAISRPNGRGRRESRRIEEDSDHIQVGQRRHRSIALRKLFELGRADRSAVARRMAHGQASVFAVAHEEGIIKKQPGQEETDEHLPGSGGASRMGGFSSAHVPAIDASTLDSIAARGQEDARAELRGEEVGIIARGAMIPVVGSNTEVQAL